jgi:UrcA family protein
MSRAIKFAIAALAASAIINPAVLAQPGVERVSVEVPYSDLNMSRSAGGETLLKRIESAARRVCGAASPKLIQQTISVAKCRSEAVEDAVRRLNIQTLTFAWSGEQPATSIAAR